MGVGFEGKIVHAKWRTDTLVHIFCCVFSNTCVRQREFLDVSALLREFVDCFAVLRPYTPYTPPNF